MGTTRQWGLILALALVCAVAGFAQDSRAELDALVARWTESLRTEDIDTFLACYWDDAIRINYGPGGQTDMTQGMAELRAEEEQSFADLDFAALNLVYDEPVRFFPGNANPIYIYPNSQFGFMDVFEFERRGGRYRIVMQYLLPHPQGE